MAIFKVSLSLGLFKFEATKFYTNPLVITEESPSLAPEFVRIAIAQDQQRKVALDFAISLADQRRGWDI